MSNNTRFVIEGLDELREQLRNLPSELTGEAAHIIEAAGNGAAAEVKGHYERVSGDLVDGVSVDFQRDQFAASASVKSAAKHAYIYENGTQVRHTNAGANRGAMPPAPPGRAFIPALIRARRRMYAQLEDLLKRNGLVVTGSAG